MQILRLFLFSFIALTIISKAETVIPHGTLAVPGQLVVLHMKYKEKLQYLMA